MALSSGTKLGPYEIQSLIGAGGMGEVYRAHDSRLDRTVAVKVLPASFSADRDRMQRFAQEARAAAALNHPNILSIFDIGDQQGSLYVVSELLEGETLRERLRNGALSARKAIDYALQVARGLAAALNHPNILSIFDIGDQQGSPYVVSELLEGETLRERLRSGPLSSHLMMWLV